jgi:vacuolar-type H+-ATPase subunit B/Vma2
MNRALEKRITKLERDADRAAIMPPPELIPYMRGEKIETEEEKIKKLKKYRQIFDEWMVRMDRAAARGTTIDAALLKEILNAIPEPTRTTVRERLIESYNARKSEK